jgi:hypothetical protein
MNKLLISIAFVVLAAASPAVAQTSPSGETPGTPASPLTPTGPAIDPATGEPITTTTTTSSGTTVTNPNPTFGTIMEGTSSSNGTDTVVSGSSIPSNSASSMPPAPLINGLATAPGYPAPLLSPNTAYPSALLSKPATVNPGLITSPAPTRSAANPGSSMSTTSTRSSFHGSMGGGHSSGGSR